MRVVGALLDSCKLPTARLLYVLQEDGMGPRKYNVHPW